MGTTFPLKRSGKNRVTRFEPAVAGALTINSQE